MADSVMTKALLGLIILLAASALVAPQPLNKQPPKKILSNSARVQLKIFLHNFKHVFMKKLKDIHKKIPTNMKTQQLPQLPGLNVNVLLKKIKDSKQPRKDFIRGLDLFIHFATELKSLKSPASAIQDQPRQNLYKLYLDHLRLLRKETTTQDKLTKPGKLTKENREKLKTKSWGEIRTMDLTFFWNMKSFFNESRSIMLNKKMA